ncbi:DUF4932 domain-containing protein [Pontimicrobium aquaticum]|uniref:DUF4932 domain-containing protein n=1 Tax=Pontimicrobium aquaticum TaxID=2565367 RepID=A0A4U0F0X4_9FLAO|nr:DUF4932 domain-containing protein [Pontimicrobium aquaticum]TJY38075.1 DUF4932 domain-containing protein [Pontimicrobium aquaticum]
MRKLLLLLNILCFVACSKVKPVKKEIDVKTNFNIETLVICFEIADKGFWNFPFDDFQPMKTQARNQFKEYKNHEAIKLIDTLVSKGFWFDAMVEVMLKSSPLPKAELIYEIDKSTLDRLSNNKSESTSLIKEFIAAMNEFYLDANMSEYFKENADYFKAVNQEVSNNLPNEQFIATMEDYYGKQNDSYTLIPSPTLYHTMGFGKRINADIGYKVFNVFGPLIVTKDSLDFGFGFDDSKEIDELTVHEFGHSFINPILDLAKNTEIIDKYKYLFDPIKKEMQNQGYGSWRSCVAEHFVRLGEIRISYAMRDSARAEKLRDEYVNKRKFIYIPHLEKSIEEYETNRNLYKSIDDYIPSLLNSLSKIRKQ